MNERLKLISGEESLVLGPIDGQETLPRATDAFRYIDSNFEHWSCAVAGPPSKETPVQVYEMARDSTFQEMFDGFGVTLDRLALTQAQIKEFVKRYPDWLKKGGNGTFFLFNASDEFFVAVVYLFSDGRLGARVRRLTLERVFRAKKRHRLVLKSHWALSPAESCDLPFQSAEEPAGDSAGTGDAEGVGETAESGDSEGAGEALEVGDTPEDLSGSLKLKETV